MKFLYSFFLFLFQVSFFFAQTNAEKAAFKEYYPIAERSYISGGFGNNPYEQIIFDAKPSVYYSVYNDIREALTAEEITPGYAVYVAFLPQIRMFAENSKPIKTPSYKVLFGWQPIIKTSADNFLTFAIETGHYSNGQNGSAFDENFEDESDEGQAVYETITDDTDLAAILNRENGNFSTNLTRITFNYRLNSFTETNMPKRIYSITAGYQLYHNNFLGIIDVGGYNPEDIKLYGRHRLEFGYEFTGYYKKMRYSAAQEVFLQLGAHPSVTPYRSESKFILNPWNTDLGFFVQFDFGFDDYNYRFVDSYPRLSFGVSWDWFTPFVIKKPTTE